MGTKSKGGPRIKCNRCGDVIQSMSVHDFVWCSCKNVAIDGGSDYMKVSFDPECPEGYEVLKEEEE